MHYGKQKRKIPDKLSLKLGGLLGNFTACLAADNFSRQTPIYLYFWLIFWEVFIILVVGNIDKDLRSPTS